MRGDAAGKDAEKVMRPLFPRLHVNDTIKGGPRTPPRNKMALYEQFSVPSRRFRSASAAATAAAPWQPHRAGGASTAVPSTWASLVGVNDRSLFPSFCVPSNEPVHLSEHINTNLNGRAGNATRVESGKQSTQLKSKDTYAAGSTAECISQHRESNIKNSSGKKLTNDDDFTVPSVFCSGVPHPTQDKGQTQEKFTPFPTTSPYKSGPTMSKSSAKCSNTDKRHLDGMNVSDTRSRDSPNIKDKEPSKMMRNLEAEETSSSFQMSKEKLGKTDTKVLSSCRDRLSSINVSDKQRSRTEGYQVRSRKENSVESQNPPQAGNEPSHTDIESNGTPNVLEQGLRETGEKRKRSTGHHDVWQKDDWSDSSVESLPGLEISPDDVVSAIGPKHFWKARKAIVNQQRIFAVQVFELHRLIKVQKLIAASPHLLIEGDPCIGNALVTSKKKLAEGNVEKQLSSAKNKDDVQPALRQAGYSKDNTEENRTSPSQDDVAGVRHSNQAATDGAVSSNPPTMPAAPDNKQNNWCIPPPQNQWLVPVMSPSEGLVYKPYTVPCPPAGSFLAPFYASCTLSHPSTAGDFMNSAYGIAMPHQPQHMGVPGPPPIPPTYFPPFSMPVMNPVAPASAAELGSHVAASKPNGHVKQHSRSSCSLRSEAVSAGIRRLHASRDSELQGSSASSPFDRRQQGEGRGPASSAGDGQRQVPSSGSKEDPGRVIRVVPHTARTASESAARIFRSIQMERRHNDS